MGVLNITPDSFSGDGMLGRQRDIAVHADFLLSGGADIIDVGGESSRPGAVPVTHEEESRRVVPTVRHLTSVTTALISVDTVKAPVADRELAAGARIINDVSGRLHPDLAETVARAGAGIVLTHRGNIPTRDRLMSEVLTGLSAQMERAARSGIPDNAIIVDPGLGFGKTWLDNFEIIRQLHVLRSLGRPILVGPSRKGMIGKVLHVGPGDRVEGTIALVSLCIANGADIVRVHDVRQLKRVVTMIDALVRPT
ncbi:MAG: dihydropteroate synthase [Chloroflexota bacterium]